MFQKAARRLLGKPEVQFPLQTCVPETRELGTPELLRFSLCQGGGAPLASAVAGGDSVSAGQALATGEAGFVLASPVTGKVEAVAGQPDIRGDRRGSAVLVEPSAATASGAFEPLDPETAAPDTLAERVREAGILSSTQTPMPLLSQLCPQEEPSVDTVVVLAADREPGVSVALQLLRERPADASAAARLLGRIAGAGRVVLAILDGETDRPSKADGVELLPLEAEYPHTLPSAILRRLGIGQGGRGTPIVPLETALAALDAVREGKVQEQKLLTLIGPDQSPVANYRVPLGTPILDVLSHAGIKPGERDKVVAGGPLQGFALFSVLGSIDAGVDALTVIPADRFPSWSVEPCVNCGACIDVCPLDLQVQLIGRYAEFELFDRTRELGIEECLECGLCAVVCTGRRPLLQYIRLAMKELEVSG